MGTTIRVFACLLVLIVGWAVEGRGQGFQGGIRGAVKDSGGVIPGAEVTLTNQGTSISRTTTTNAAGEYNFPNLAPGTYRLRIALQGYKAYAQEGIPVGTQQFITLDITLDVGTVAETVTVSGQSPIIETSNASTGTVLNAEALQTLPSQGRAAFMIGNTVPTVVPSGDGQYNRQQDQTNVALVSLGGGTRRGNNYTLDGVPISDMRNRASAHPSIESLEDMKVQVHTYDAEMGRTGGGVFNTTLKSGTNNFRGTAFFQTRPIWGQWNNHFGEKAGRPKPDSPYYLGGGALGGPIVRNRTFFWFTTESYHDVQTRNVSTLFPTAAMRRGDFSAVTNSAGQPVTIYNPITGLPFAGNQIPSPMMSPVALAMLEFMPLPDTDRDNGSTNYTRTSLIKSNFSQLYSVKLEHKFTDNVSVTGFYLYNSTNEPEANFFGSADQSEPTRFADPNDYYLRRRPQILALNNTWVLSNTSVLALRFGRTEFPDNDTVTIDYDPRSLPFSTTYKNQIQLDKFPQVRIRGYDQGHGARTLGAINPTEINWKSTSANATLSKSARRAHDQVRRRLAEDGDRDVHPRRRRRLLRVREGHDLLRRRHRQHDERQCVRVVPAGLPVGPDGPHDVSLGVDAAERLHALLRRLRAGRLAHQLEAHGELRRPPRTRKRVERAGQQLHRRLRPGDDERAVLGRHSGRSGGGNAGADRGRRLDVRRRRRQQDVPGQRAGGEVVAEGRRRLRRGRSNRAARRIRPVLGAVQLPDPEHLRQQLRAGRLQPEHDPHEQPRQPDHASRTRSRTASSCLRATAAAR